MPDMRGSLLVIAGLLLVACGARETRPAAADAVATPVATPEAKSVETPAPQVEVALNLLMTAYRGGEYRRSRHRHFALKDGVLRVGLAGVGSGLPTPTGLDPEFLGATAWEVTLTPAQLAALAEALRASGLLRETREPIGGHVPRADHDSLEITIEGKVGEAAMSMTVDSGWFDAAGEPHAFLQDAQRAAVPELRTTLAALQQLADTLTEYVVFGDGDLMLERHAYEISSDSYSEIEHYRLSGGALRRQYRFSGASGHMRGPEREEEAAQVDAAGLAALTRQMRDAGLFVERRSVVESPLHGEETGIHYRLVADLGGEKSRIALDVSATGEPKDATLVPVVEAIVGLQRTLDGLARAK